MAGTLLRNRIYSRIMNRFVFKGLLRGHPLWLVVGVSASFLKLKSVLTSRNGTAKVFSYQLDEGKGARFIQLPRLKTE